MSGRKRTLLLAVLVATGGCYTYRPVRPTDAALDARVRATVSPTQAVELAPAMRDVTSTFSGKLVERSDDRILMEVPVHGTTQGMSSAALHNRVAIPLSELVTLETRTLSKWRTGLVIGGVVAAVSGTWAALGGQDLFGDKPKTGTDNAVVTMFRLRMF